MRPPLAGRRESARRLAEELRRRLEPVERILPVRLPGASRSSDREDAVQPAPDPDAAAAPAPAASQPAPEPGAATDSTPDATASQPAPTAVDVAARIDAARARLRETIASPADGED